MENHGLPKITPLFSTHPSRWLFDVCTCVFNLQSKDIFETLRHLCRSSQLQVGLTVRVRWVLVWDGVR